MMFFFDLSEDSLTFLNYVLEFKTNPNSNYIQNLLMDKKFSDEINSEYIEKIEPDDIIIFIEKLFEPNNFTYLKYDENFSSNIKDYDYSQIWCGGPVLLRKI